LVALVTSQTTIDKGGQRKERRHEVPEDRRPCARALFSGRTVMGRRGRQPYTELDADSGPFSILLRQGAGLVRKGRHRPDHRVRYGLGCCCVYCWLRWFVLWNRRSSDSFGHAKKGRGRRGADEHLRQRRPDLLLAEELRREWSEGLSRPQDR